MDGLLRAHARQPRPGGRRARRGGLILLALVGPAFAADPTRAEADRAEAAGDWPAALEALERCAESSPDRDARSCATRAAQLRPHAEDAFAGWRELQAIRRDYRTLGSDAALARMEAALAAHPGSPAAPEMRAWIAHERLRRGEDEAAVALEEHPASGWVQARVADRALEARRLAAAGVGAAFAVVYALTALRGPGPWKVRSAMVAAVALGVAPAVLAWRWDPALGDGFVAAGAWIAAAVWLSGRAPAWVGVPGFLGGFVAVGWLAGWFPSLGF